MAASSTRSPSPAGNASAPASPELSPRSKVKALLATVDDDSSDEDARGPIDRRALFKSIDRGNTTADTKLLPISNEEEEDDDEDEEEIVRPRGRLAARMRANDTTEAKDTSKSPDNISQRPDKPLQTHTTTADKDEDGEIANPEDDDEDEVITAPPRRRLARPVRSTTPEAAADENRPPSPGLFVSPSPRKSPQKSAEAAGSDTDDELPVDINKNERFLALVARKRQERLAKEAEEERKQKARAERLAEQMPANAGIDEDDDDVSDITDDDGGRKLTQDVSRPARKASKKALEEMNRETQRLNRSLQLAHEAKTKKRITKASLFERFNFRTDAAPAEAKLPSSSRPTTPGSVHQTDVEMGDAGTPPSSPPTAPKPVQGPSTPSAAPSAPTEATDDVFGEANELPSLDDALEQTHKLDKGKGKAVEPSIDTPRVKKPAITKPKRQVRVKLPPVQANLVTIDSDDELEITNSKKGKVSAIFDRLPAKKAQENKSMEILRRLANLSSPAKEPAKGRRDAKPSMTPGELQMSLQQRARAQAKLERERRLEYLKSKGIAVQTEEEREREREDVEDIVARARQEVEEIMQREREDAKKARKEEKKKGGADPLAWDDSSDDESYKESGKEEPEEVELSGSEEEGDEDEENEDEEGEDEDEPAANPVFEDEAAEDEESEAEKTPQAIRNVVSDDDEEDNLPAVKSRRPKKHVHIVSDDEEDQVEATPKPKTTYPKSPSAPNTSSPKVPTSVLRSATKSFIPGLPIPVAGPAGLGLTQIFAGTMDDSQAGPASGSPQEFMPSLDKFPDSQFSATADQSQSEMVLNSQPTQKADTQARETQTQGVQLHFSQSQVHGFDSLMQMDSTQMTDLIEPTQDGGFQDFSPLKQRFINAPQSTVDTVLLGGTPDHDHVQDSPLARRKGKLRRRGESSLSISSIPPTDIPRSPSGAPRATTHDDAEMSTNTATSAFKLMQKAAKRKKRRQEKFDKKKSEAMEMVEDQAMESEDEYAGLGGADGEDSSEEDEELVKEMIDDAAGNDADEAKLAGLFADRERAADAAQVDKLFHDITTGMLRKRRRGGAGNNDFDLSDSDDGGEAKRRMKRRQFAKMQKALFADERIGKIAENPRNAAFLKSIEDRNDSDDEWDINESYAGADSAAESAESQSQDAAAAVAQQEPEAIPDSQPPADANGRKRARADDNGDHAARPPPNARRTRNGARPSSLSEVQRTLSSLLEDPNASIIPATDLGSDSEEESERQPTTSSSPNKENRRRGPASSKVAVVDRIALKRNASSNASGVTDTGSARLAFAAPSSTAAGAAGFRVPALLRRATTNSLISNSSASSTSSTTGGQTGMASKAGAADGKLKKSAGKRSGVNYFARENERLAKVAEVEKRREARKWKGVEGRSKDVRGLFGGGKFE
ncbi:MRC1-like domain-containing protein [Whalleya microplaca]|nr:MRC1-like domain-containing protein [Whalleya microplaca]